MIDITEFDPLKKYITYESETKVIFEFPNGVIIDYMNGVKSFMNYFNDVTVETDFSFMIPKRITCIKKVSFMIGIGQENISVFTKFLK